MQVHGVNTLLQGGGGSALNLTEAAEIAAIVGTIVTAVSFYMQFGRLRTSHEANKSEGSAEKTGQSARPRGASGESADGPRNHGWPKRAVVSLALGIVAGVIVYVIAAAVYIANPSTSASTSGSSPPVSTSPTPLNTSSASGAAPMPSTNGPVVHLVSPAPRTAVSKSKGFTVRGSFSNLGNDTIWLTDYDGGYTVDSEAALATNDTWAASDSDLGNAGESLPFPLTVRLILANEHCAAKLQATYNTNGDYLPSLPGGCIIADALTVNVTTP